MKKETGPLKPRIYGLIAVGIAAALCVLFINQHQFSQISAQFSPNDKYIESNDPITSEVPEIEKLIKKSMRDSGIPGLSAVIVHGGQTVYKSGFGFADMQTGTKVTGNTLFQLGSNSKAFTALGVLQLEKNGLISLNDPITKYIPWLKLYYSGTEVQVTIDQFLHHTSGVPAGTIESIPELSGPQALEQTVKILAGSELKSKPGERYEYATLNYDVLGLLIQKVSGSTYEAYMEQNVLKPLGLNGTQMYLGSPDPNAIAEGYKLQFLVPADYQAPVYDGNKPAGYILSNADDMAEWLKVQMGTSASSVFDNALIKESHAPNTGVVPFGENMFYADGWIVYDNNGPEIFHSGSNPNFSSYIVFRPSEKIGVAVLCNSNSENTTHIGENIMDILLKRPAGGIQQDFRMLIDCACSFIAAALLFFIARSACLLARSIKRVRRENPCNTFKASKVAVLSAVMLLIGAAVYLIPALLQSSWGYLAVWYPFTIECMAVLIYIQIALAYCNMLFKCFKNKKSDS